MWDLDSLLAERVVIFGYCSSITQLGLEEWIQWTQACSWGLEEIGKVDIQDKKKALQGETFIDDGLCPPGKDVLYPITKG